MHSDMTLMTMFKSPEYFKAGASGAPVTDWKLYDTHYTERYLGDPNAAGEVYEKASVFPYATNLQGPLLIYHGMADDNVIFENTTRVLDRLQAKSIPFETMLYPGQRHGVRGNERQLHLWRTYLDFLDRTIGTRAPAKAD